jgi:hypothetical protein
VRASSQVLGPVALVALVAVVCSGIAGGATACGFDGTGSADIAPDGGEAGGPGGEAGSMGTDGGADVEGGPIVTDSSMGPCTQDSGGAGVLCDGKCVDTARNHENCGSCGSACAATAACEGACVEVAQALTAFRYEYMCQNGNSPCGAGAPPPPKTATLTGTPGKSYVLGVRVRGVVEQDSYSGGTAGSAQGTNASFFIVGGTQSDTQWNSYSLAVSSPAKISYLNSGAAGHNYVDGIDYKVRIDANAGATITLDAASSDTLIIKNRDQANGTAIVIPSIPPAPAAFDGQFVQIDVESVALAP